ncbi:DJ-1/PfpI family protein [Geomonas sp. RF6]|uniref:DJ-1/PfpI family protein n=1 Tax=Geomonas sp. RF6 TaxID=2897342 RepID=UPI001E2F318C|nr:DJ-1/PfpI family protein [Geomonas sp. RF6]UFS70135.1 DJ-1/PfpI family protein [Geomonas sp. RF6]
MVEKKRVAILIIDDVEVLDFAGPFEVFSVTNEVNGYGLMEIFTVSGEKREVRARNGLSVIPHYALGEAPVPDILIIPGGSGTRPLLHDNEVLSWIVTSAQGAERVLSVCTGALLLGKAGLLNGLRCTTHHSAFGLLAEIAPESEVLRDARFVDEGKVVTSAGISAGIDMSLHVVASLFGKEVAQGTAAYMEYPFP